MGISLTHTDTPYFNLTAEEFDPVFWDVFLCFCVPPSFCVLFPFFGPCPCVFFSPFCFPPAFCCSPLCPLLGAFPFFFIKKRGVVQMVLLLGGFFSSERLTLLNTRQTQVDLFNLLVKNWNWSKSKNMELHYLHTSPLPVYLLEANHVVRYWTASLFYDVGDAGEHIQRKKCKL